jgi:hypothetical protein
MGSNYSGIDGVFFLTIATMAVGFFGLAIRYCLQSRCTECTICYGLLVVKRDAQAENTELREQLAHGINPTSPSPPSPRRPQI